MLGQLVTGTGHGAYGLGQRQTWKNHICRSKARDKPPSFMRGFMTQIHSLLHAGKTAAISGLGGIGKTQTAVEYAFRYREEYQYVLWVQANTLEALLSNFVAL